MLFLIMIPMSRRGVPVWILDAISTGSLNAKLGIHGLFTVTTTLYSGRWIQAACPIGVKAPEMPIEIFSFPRPEQPPHTNFNWKRGRNKKRRSRPHFAFFRCIMDTTYTWWEQVLSVYSRCAWLMRWGLEGTNLQGTRSLSTVVEAAQQPGIF